MFSDELRRLISVLAFAPLLLNAQIGRQRNQVPVKSWAAPLYWQPSQREAGVIASRPEVVAAGTPADPPPTATPLVFVGITPCRLVDTRPSGGFSGAFGPPSLNGNESRTFPLPSSTACSIPSSVAAYSLYVSVVPPGIVGYITMYPTGQPLPIAATLTDVVPGGIVTNSAIVPAGTSGSIDVYAEFSTDLVIDINGYYVTQTSLLNAINDTALGFLALFQDTGGKNTAIGDTALSSNTSGSDNVALGYIALGSNSKGNWNVALGDSALVSNDIGSNNTAVGANALTLLMRGTNNLGVGFSAGVNATTGDYNVYIANEAPVTTESNTIRIGESPFQTRAFIAGIWKVNTGNMNAVPVLIDSNGQLGTMNSSRRFKEDIQDMGDASSGLMRLRPVTFRYQTPFTDGSKPIQYGLIAEEVAEVYPDLVAHSAGGEIETVKYQLLDSMLLNELQRQEKVIAVQKSEIAVQKEQIRALDERLAQLDVLIRAGSR